MTWKRWSATKDTSGSDRSKEEEKLLAIDHLDLLDTFDDEEENVS